MLFTKYLRDGVRSGAITRSVRVWMSASVSDLLKVAKHGRGENVYLVEFHYIAAPR